MDENLSVKRISWGSSKIERIYPMLLNSLCGVPCCGPAFRYICGQLVQEKLLDFLPLRNFFLSPEKNKNENFRELLLMFTSRYILTISSNKSIDTELYKHKFFCHCLLICWVHHRKPADLYKLLSILMAINNYPVTSHHFKKIIEQYVNRPVTLDRSLNSIELARSNFWYEFLLRIAS